MPKLHFLCCRIQAWKCLRQINTQQFCCTITLGFFLIVPWVSPASATLHAVGSVRKMRIQFLVLQRKCWTTTTTTTTCKCHATSVVVPCSAADCPEGMQGSFWAIWSLDFPSQVLDIPHQYVLLTVFPHIATSSTEIHFQSFHTWITHNMIKRLSKTEE